MTSAATIESEPVIPEPARPRPESVPSPSPEPDRDLVTARLPEDLRVERIVLRSAVRGAIIGALVCAPVWVGLVLLALRNSSTALWPPVGMAVGLGLYAGLFLGGSTGTLIGSKTLERYEHANLPAAPK